MRAFGSARLPRRRCRVDLAFGEILAVGSGALGFLVGEVSQTVGVSIQTLRLWERERLVIPERTERGYRVYGEEDVRRLQRIKHLRNVEGLNFAAIRQRLGHAGQRSNVQREDSDNEFGERLRSLRLREHKTQKEAAEATGLSVSFISSVERGATGASMESVSLLAGVYGVEAKDLLGMELPRNASLVRAAERAGGRWEGGTSYEQMTPRGSPVEFTRLRMPSRTGSGRFYSHGGEEVVHLLRGRLFVELQDQETFELSAGDTLRYSSATPHRWWTGEQGAEALHVEAAAADDRQDRDAASRNEEATSSREVL